MSKNITKKAKYCQANLGESTLQSISDNIEKIKRSSIKQNYILEIIDICRQDISPILSIYSVRRNNLE